MPPVASEPLSSLSSAAGAPTQTATTPVTTPVTNTAPAAEKTVVPVVTTPVTATTDSAKRFANPEAKAIETKTETKTETVTDSKVEAKPGEKPAEPAAVAKPEEWTLAAPKDVTVPEPTLKAVEAFAKEHKLTKDVAEKILARDLAAETSRQATAKTEADNIGNVWHDQVMAHPELGGALAKQSEANVNKAMLAFATKEERELIYGSPFVNNPIFRAIMNRAAKAIPVEDGVPPASAVKSGNPVTAKSPAERIYGRA